MHLTVRQTLFYFYVVGAAEATCTAHSLKRVCVVSQGWKSQVQNKFDSKQQKAKQQFST